MKRLLSIFTNERPFTSEGEWQQLTPFGIFANSKGRQKVNQDSCGRMVAAFNDARAKAGSSWRGVPIFVGHPPERGGDPAHKGRAFPRIGSVMEMEVRSDGLYGKVAWNNLGQENAREGHYIYPSPTWYYTKEADGAICPNELDHIGMTNTPNIPGVSPWTNESEETETTMNKEHIARLKAALKLDDAADEDAICNAVDKVVSDLAGNETKLTAANTLATNEKTARTTAEGSLATAENALKEARKAHAKTLLDVAVNEGRITAAQRPQHESAFEGDFAAASNALAAIKKPSHDTRPLSVDVRGAKVSIATNEDRQRIINTAVNEMMAKEGLSYSDAYLRIKSDPQYKPVFEAMKKPGEKS